MESPESWNLGRLAGGTVIGEPHGLDCYSNDHISVRQEPRVLAAGRTSPGDDIAWLGGGLGELGV